MKPISTFGLAVVAATTTLLGFTFSAIAQPTQEGAAPPVSAGQSPPGAGYGAPEGGGRGFGRPITLAQYQGRFRDRIMQADTNHDGRISLAEWTAYRAQMAGNGGGRRGGGGFGDPMRQFQMMDANRDNYVTPAEIDAVSARRFARMDLNHDGVVTPDERRALRGGGMGVGGIGGGEPPPQ